MNRITTQSGRVGHIAGVIEDTNDGRLVTTVCGRTHRESEFRVDNTLDPCSACDNKFFDVVEEESAKTVEKPKETSKETPKPTETAKSTSTNYNKTK